MSVAERREHPPSLDPDQRIPIIILTGFLGSGKTTFLNALMQHSEQPKTLILMNEYGEVSIDHDLVAFNREEVAMETLSGCVCCTIRSDLAQTLSTAPHRFSRAGKVWFERVIIETTGLADPAPLIKTLLDDPGIARRYRLDCVLTTIDAVNAMDTLARRLEAVRQVAVADVLLLTKTDLASQSDVERLNAALDRLNPSAARLQIHHGAMDPVRFATLLASVPRVREDPDAWLDPGLFAPALSHAQAGAPRFVPADIDTLPPNRLSPPVHLMNRSPVSAVADVHGYAGDVIACCFTLETPVHGAALDAWLDSLLLFRGPDLLRVKGIIHIAEIGRPMVIHGVQHVFHPPMLLARWPSEDRRSRFVFITRGISAEELRETLRFFNTAESIRQGSASDTNVAVDQRPKSRP